MAGESPDKSDQRKSSGEAVSGERDPRLTVFRESASSAAGGADGTDRSDSGSRGSTKVATANRTEGSTSDSEDGPAEAEGSGEADGDRITAAPERPESERATSERPPSDDRTMTLKGDGSSPSWARRETAAEPEPEKPEQQEKAEKSGKAEGSEKSGAGSADAGDAKDGDAHDGSAKDEDAEAPGEPKAAGAPPEPKSPREPEGSQESGSSEESGSPQAPEAKKSEAEESEAPEKQPEKPQDRTDAKDAKGSAEPKGAPVKAGSASGSTSEPDSDSGSDSDAKPVDQATAVFRTLPKPATDQPTTALKLPKPSATEDGGKDAKKGETPAERTSTFVPLRRDDRPAPSAEPAASEPAPAPASAPAPAPAPSGIPEAERTRQQPMPPMPPLDLLAELTNKPAPPETPVRTMVRRVKIWTPLVLLAVVVFAVVQSVRPLPDPQLSLTAASTYSFEGDKPALPWPDHGQGVMSVAGLGTVDSFGEAKPVPIASVTKSMTAYIIMRDHPMKVGQDGAQIPVDALAEKEGGYDESGNESTLNTIKAGDKLSQKDALSALMIPSANNVARLLARWDAGSQDAFVKKMNEAAEELGMKDTKYTDPSGLDATTVSTAADQVKLGLELVKMPALMVITQLPSWIDPSGKNWPNWNTLVPYNGAIGIKTGTTTKAGGNLLFAATKDVDGTKQYVVGAILSQRGPSIIDAVNAASKKVLIPTRELLESKTVVKKGQTVGYVDDGLGGRTPVVATKDLKAAGWASLKVSVSLTDEGRTIAQTAAAGTVVGQLTVGSGPGQVTAPVALQSDKAEPGFGAKLTRVG
ncbi:D-alanyl-D-alanine carboxypeptidase [Streptomyces sp. NPDC059096]|uniref:D-alanyl-D-alanine carboxypeptidase n=1 Tax=Streptomyces sp. NPDC059096 TaxID=3346727 RepID=UPI0036BD8511